jgi:hypothetical protein
MIRRLATALVLIAAMPLAAAAGPAKGQTDRKSQAVTVGDFAVMLAAATGNAPNLEAGKALERLARSGVPLGKPGEILKEGKLVEILGYYGVKAETRTPDQPVTLGKAETALLAASGSLVAAAGASAPSEPDQTCIDLCLKERNHGMCVNCCKACPGTTATRCAHFCPQLNKESPSEPLP